MNLFFPKVFKRMGFRFIYLTAITAVTSNTRPQRVFPWLKPAFLVDVNQPLPWFFTPWIREVSFLFLEYSEEHQEHVAV